MTNIVYSKFNNYRKDKYAIYTTIEQTNDGKKYVYKNASGRESQKFLDSLQSKYKFVAKLYTSSKIIPIAPLAQGTEKLRFDYLPYPNLKTIITEKLVQEDIDAAIKLITDFFDAIFGVNLSDINTANYTLESYDVFFGDSQPIDKGCYMVDINFNNFLVYDDRYYLVDYEWVFDRLVPADYLILRNIYYLLEDIPNLAKHTVDALLKHYKFDQTKSIFVDYESKFIKSVAKNCDTDLESHLKTNIYRFSVSTNNVDNNTQTPMSISIDENKPLLSLLEEANITLNEKNSIITLQQKEIEQSKATLNQIENSLTWKLTKPFRSFFTKK